MSTILYVWVTVAVTSMTPIPVKEWRPFGVYDTAMACHTAANVMGFNTKTYRCISKKTGELS